MSLHTPEVRRDNRIATAIGIALVLALIGCLGWLMAGAYEEEARQHEATRSRVAAHWASAGVTNPVTTLKDSGTKRTVGGLGSCEISIEGFESSVVVEVVGTNVPNVTQETTFGASVKPSPDSAAFEFVKQLPTSMQNYCSHG